MEKGEKVDLLAPARNQPRLKKTLVLTALNSRRRHRIGISAESFASRNAKKTAGNSTSVCYLEQRRSSEHRANALTVGRKIPPIPDLSLLPGYSSS